MSNKPFVFLDTNAFIRENYNFSEHSKLYSLKKLSNEGKISIITSTVAIRECENRIKSELTVVANKFKNLHKQFLTDERNRKFYQAWGVLLNTTDYKKKIDSIQEFGENKNEMITVGIQQLKNYVKEANITVLDTSSVSVEDVLSDYFSGVVPFEDRKNKKNEFPDAIMVKSLASYLDEKDRLILISEDKGFKAAVEAHLSNNNVEKYKLEELLSKLMEDELNFLYPNYKSNLIFHLVNHSDEVFEYIKSKIEIEEVVIEGSYTNNNGMSQNYQYDDIEIMDLSNFRILPASLYIINIDADSGDIDFQVDCHMIVEIEASYIEEDNSYWDSEEKSYSVISHGRAYEKHEAKFTCSINMENDFDKFELNSLKFKLVLNENSLVDYTHKSAEELYGEGMEDAKNDMYDALEDEHRH